MADRLLPSGDLGKGKKLSHYEGGEEGVGSSRVRSRAKACGNPARWEAGPKPKRTRRVGGESIQFFFT